MTAIEKLDIEKFNPTVAEIQSIVDECKGITISDFTNKAQLKLVKDQRSRLSTLRGEIVRYGKKLRQEAVAFSKAVISKEKDLVALIEPEENRLSALEDKADKEKERADRVELLPKRRDRLTAIGDDVDSVSDEDILDMDGSTFEGYWNKRFADKNEADRLVLAEREAKLKEGEEKIQREKEAREREESARKDERERAEREAKDKADREAREKSEHEAKTKAVAEQKENEAKEAALKLASDKKYQEFIASHGWTKETAGEFYVEVNGNTHSLYKKVGEITL